MPAAEGTRVLGALLVLYMAASLLHFAHNAEFLSDYPNLPGSWTRWDVYLAWLASAAIGVAGFLLHHAGRRVAGLALLGIYAALGFGGLLHYMRAPFGAHTAAMNFTIGFEAAAAAALLFVVVTAALRNRRGTGSGH